MRNTKCHSQRSEGTKGVS